MQNQEQPEHTSYDITLEVNHLLHNQETFKNIWNKTCGKVVDCVKKELRVIWLDRDKLIKEIEAIWEDTSVQNKQLHRIDSSHIKDMFELWTVLVPPSEKNTSKTYQFSNWTLLK